MGWTKMSLPLLMIECCIGILARVLLSCFDWTNQAELSTPVTNFNRLLEGHHLSRTMDPYEGGIFYQSPLLLILRIFNLDVNPGISSVIWVAVDLIIALCIAELAHLYGKRRTTGLLLWLLNPFAIMTCVAKSSIVFTNMFLLLSVLFYALACQSKGSARKQTRFILFCSFSLSLASCISLHCALILIPFTMGLLLDRTKSNGTRLAKILIFGFCGHQILSQSTFYMIFGSHFVNNVYGTQILFYDLMPTIGLWWYFFIEIFDHFRLFFIGIFHLLTVSHLLPLSYVYSENPLFAIALCWGVVTIYKPYPSLGDYAVWHSLLVIAIDRHLLSFLMAPLLWLGLTLYSLALLPSFHYIWLYSGTGNSNFFYASTLVWAISQAMIVLDFASAWSKYKAYQSLSRERQNTLQDGSGSLVRVSF